MIALCSRSIQWMVSHHVPMPRMQRPVPGAIEAMVLEALTEPMDCPHIARRLGMLTPPQRYEQVRNALYRLLEKNLVRRHSAGPGRITCRRVTWERT